MIQLGNFGDMLRIMGITSFLGGGSQFVLTYFWIILLLPAALIWPNTQQIMDKFEPSFNKVIDNHATTLLVCRYSPAWVIILAFVLTSGILALSQISEFLYFQF